MKRMFFMAAMTALAFSGVNRVSAVELLISGNFENPGGATGEVPFWTLSETVTNSSASVNSAELSGPVADVQLWLRAFEGGTGLGLAQGNFDNDALPGGDVDGRDFLLWQRGGSPAPLSAPDLAIWQENYGTSSTANKVNARLIQKVPGVAGDTYTFQGTSTFEEDYSGFVTTLDASGPFGAIPSPTTTQFRMEFLNSGGNVIGSPAILNLKPEQTFPGFPIVHSPLVAVAPAGTVDVRVVAEALDMVYNNRADTVDNFQSAYFNDFSLSRSGAPGTPLLGNGDLNLGTPSALDFWNRVETVCCNGEVQRTASFANHTPGGTLGVWLSPFFGSHPVFQPNPVDGSISQTVNAVAGGTYNFSGWMKFEQNYSGGVDTIAAGSTGLLAGQASPTQSLITLEFLNNLGEVISSSVIDVKEERQALVSCGGNANSQACGPAGNGWTQHTFSNVVAPVGAVQVRLRADMVDGVFNIDPQQSAFWDDFSLDGPTPPPLSALVTVPEPTSLALIACGLLAMGMRRAKWDR